MSKTADLIYYWRNRDVILNRAKDYYEYNKERYRNMSEEKKQRLNEYQKKLSRN